jgi:hypothetical protein
VCENTHLNRRTRANVIAVNKFMIGVIIDGEVIYGA